MNAVALLVALTAGVSHSPAAPQGCAYTVPVLAIDRRSPIMSGNMRTTDGGCVVWLNLDYAETLRRRDVCELGAHEGGHLAGLQHSLDPGDVMYSPFVPLRRSFC